MDNMTASSKNHQNHSIIYAKIQSHLVDSQAQSEAPSWHHPQTIPSCPPLLEAAPMTSQPLERATWKPIDPWLTARSLTLWKCSAVDCIYSIPNVPTDIFYKFTEFTGFSRRFGGFSRRNHGFSRPSFRPWTTKSAQIISCVEFTHKLSSIKPPALSPMVISKVNPVSSLWSPVMAWQSHPTLPPCLADRFGQLEAVYNTGLKASQGPQLFTA